MLIRGDKIRFIRIIRRQDEAPPLVASSEAEDASYLKK